jgi:ATP-dependent Clp protease ATP-binding subunit ClpA
MIEKYEEKKNELIEKSEEIINELTVELVNKYFSPEFINRIDEVYYMCYYICKCILIHVHDVHI